MARMCSKLVATILMVIALLLANPGVSLADAAYYQDLPQCQTSNNSSQPTSVTVVKVGSAKISKEAINRAQSVLNDIDSFIATSDGNSEYECDNFGICSCSGQGDCFLMGNDGVCKLIPTSYSPGSWLLTPDSYSPQILIQQALLIDLMGERNPNISPLS